VEITPIALPWLIPSFTAFSAVVLKVGRIAPLGAILMGKGAKKQRGKNNTQGAKMLDH